MDKNTVDSYKIPASVIDSDEWDAIPEGERKKYSWRDVEGDVWQYDPSYDTFIPWGECYDLDFEIEDYFPLIRDEKIG